MLTGTYTIHWFGLHNQKDLNIPLATIGALSKFELVVGHWAEIRIFTQVEIYMAQDLLGFRSD